MRPFLLTLLCWCAAAETKAEKDLIEKLAIAQREKVALIVALARATVSGADAITKVESGTKAAAIGRKDATRTAVTIAESAQLTADANAEIARQTAERAEVERKSARVQAEQLQRTSDKYTSVLAWGFYTLAFGSISQFIFGIYNKRSERLATERKEDRAEEKRKELADELRTETKRAAEAVTQTTEALGVIQAGQERLHKICNSTLTTSKQEALDSTRESLESYREQPPSARLQKKIEAAEVKITALEAWLAHQKIETEEAEKQLKVDLAAL